MTRVRFALAAMVLGAPMAAAADDLTVVVPDIEGDVEYGAYLSGECTTCHQADGSADGIPSITGWYADDFAYAMHAYRKEVRQHPVMTMVAKRLNDEEIAALAAYFETLTE